MADANARADRLHQGLGIRTRSSSVMLSDQRKPGSVAFVPQRCWMLACVRGESMTTCCNHHPARVFSNSIFAGVIVSH